MLIQELKTLKASLTAGYADQLSLTWQGGLPAPLVPVVEPDPARARRGERSLAVVCHAYYTDLLGEVKTTIVNLPFRTDIYLSVVDADAATFTRAAFADWTAGDVDVRVVRNQGRDIAPKYVTFADVFSGGYEAVLFLHTKKSTDRVIGELWRRYLFDCLAGSPERVQAVLGLFDEDPTLGVVAPAHFAPISRWTGWNGNYEQFRLLARKIGARARSWAPPDFPSGSMFWARPEALTAITRLQLQLTDFPPEEGQVKNTIMHALERLVYVAAAKNGFRAVVVSDAAPTMINSSRDVPDSAPRLLLRVDALLVAARRALPRFRTGRPSSDRRSVGQPR